MGSCFISKLFHCLLISRKEIKNRSNVECIEFKWKISNYRNYNNKRSYYDYLNKTIKNVFENKTTNLFDASPFI